MERVPIQVDPNFKEMLNKMKHEWCIKENKEVSLREFTKILYENKTFEDSKEIKGDDSLKRLMEKLKK